MTHRSWSFIAVVVGLVAVGALALVLTTSRAQKPAPLSASYGDWKVDCVRLAEGQDRCVINQKVIDSVNNVQLLHLEIEPGQDVSAVRALVPLGAWLEPGIALRVGDDGAPMALTFAKCLPNGCLADGVITPEMAAALKAGDTATLIVADKNRKAIGLPVSLKGYETASAAVRARVVKIAPRGLLASMRDRLARLNQKSDASANENDETGEEKTNAE